MRTPGVRRVPESLQDDRDSRTSDPLFALRDLSGRARKKQTRDPAVTLATPRGLPLTRSGSRYL
ncbi:hypothetical protein DRH27_03710 [Candidatus Falkowbacteria bacterium]|nr:MAG: hypothetical protein DRH27_03710 [Candidatus Falkowbacteria bacterium]